jgi:integrase
MAEYAPLTPTVGNLRALCSTCTTVMHKAVPLAALATLVGILDVTVQQASKHIIDTAKPSLNDHLAREPETHAQVPPPERANQARVFQLSGAGKRMSRSSVDQVAAAISQFEQSTNFKDFRKFHIAQAVAFKERLQRHVHPETGRTLAKATIHSRLMALKAFTIWLAGRPGYRSKISYADADYFNVSANDERIAKAVRTRPVPSLDEIRMALAAMPAGTVLERRDRAVVAFALLSGARDNAIASFSLKHIDIAARTLFHDARVVRSKNAKTFTSTFFPVVGDIEPIVAEWIGELVAHGFEPDDPLFPATKVVPAANRRFAAVGLERKHWRDAGAIRRIFKRAFERVGLPNFNPHSFRHSLAVLGEKICRTPEEWKAYSQNFGHSSSMTTFNSYGPVAPHRQAEILNALALAEPDQTALPIQSVRLDDDQVRLILNQLAKANARELAAEV